MLKIIRNIILLLLMMINEENSNVNGTYYWEYGATLEDDEIAFYKECWKVPLPDDNMYCSGVIGGENWPLKWEDYRNASELDDLAREDYR